MQEPVYVMLNAIKTDIHKQAHVNEFQDLTTAGCVQYHFAYALVGEY
jgi:hypothetical protein